MQQLQFVELDESGRLVVVDQDGTRYAVAVDDRLRSALRPRPTTRSGDRQEGTVSPRDVQAMIRAGQTAEEVAIATGWELDRVRRFEGPVLAEREHVVALAQSAPVRANGRTDGSQTLDRRVRERLQGRGVELPGVTWDAARSEHQGPWTVVVAFSAGGRERRAAWQYDVQARSVEALDDEARWLSEDEQSLPGGLAGHPLVGPGHGEDEAGSDLMATLRQRRQRRTRRGRAQQPGEHEPTHVPGQQAMPEEVLPLEDLPYDPDTMGDPPAAHPPESAPAGAEPDEPGARATDEDDQDGEEAEDRPLGLDDLFEAFEDDEEDLDHAEPDAEVGLPDDANALPGDEDDADEDAAVPDEDARKVADADPAPAKTSARRRGRASVPSWDDIMFGSKDRRG